MASEDVETAGEELDGEHDEDGHEADARRPVVAGDAALRETRGGQGLVGRREQMHKRRADDNTGAEVLGYEERGACLHLRVASQEDGEQGTQQGTNENDEDGRNPEAHSAIVLVTGIAVDSDRRSSGFFGIGRGIVLARSEDATDGFCK